jgi:hypothetical protein
MRRDDGDRWGARVLIAGLAGGLIAGLAGAADSQLLVAGGDD